MEKACYNEIRNYSFQAKIGNEIFTVVSSRCRFNLKFRGCLHDTGTSFILVRVHPGSYLSLCICLHDTGEKSHTSTTQIQSDK